MVTEVEAAVVGVPVMTPVGDDRKPGRQPGGGEGAAWPSTTSRWRLLCTAVTGVPDRLAWAPGLVTTTRLSMTQVKLAEPAVAGAVGGGDATTGGRPRWWAGP